MKDNSNYGNKQSQHMWDKIIDLDCYKHMQMVVSDIETGERVGEDDKVLEKLFRFLRESMDYKATVMLAIQWKTFEEAKQVKLALYYTEKDYSIASQFIMFMDYLSDEIMQGKFSR